MHSGTVIASVYEPLNIENRMLSCVSAEWGIWHAWNPCTPPVHKAMVAFNSHDLFEEVTQTCFGQGLKWRAGEQVWLPNVWHCLCEYKSERLVLLCPDLAIPLLLVRDAMRARGTQSSTLISRQFKTTSVGLNSTHNRSYFKQITDWNRRRNTLLLVQVFTDQRGAALIKVKLTNK